MIENDSKPVDWETHIRVHRAIQQYWENAEKEKEMNEQNEVPVVYIPASQVHKSVRNILANEYGISREKVMEMVDQKVAAAVKQRVDALFESQSMEAFIAKQIGTCLGSTSWSSTPMKDTIRASIETQIRQLVGSSLKVDMHLSHDPTAKETK